MQINKSRFALIVIGFAACNFVVGCNSSTGATRPKAVVQKSQQSNLVINVNEKQLIAQLKSPKAPKMVNVSRGNVDWSSPQHGGIGIHLYPSVQSANEHYRKALKYRSYMMESYVPKGIGDNLLCLGSSTNPKSSGLIYMRRRNVVIETRWNGNVRSAAAFAKKLDQLILHNSTIFPKGKIIASKST